MNLDWIVDRRGDAGPVIDQGARPTCLSCATSSAHHERSGQARSIEFLHNATLSKPNGSGNFSSVKQALLAEGQPPEYQWPYDSTIDDADAKIPKHIPGPFERADYDVSSGNDIDSLVIKLQAGLLPVIGLATTRPFIQMQGGILIDPAAHLDGHAVLLVGAARYQGPDTPQVKKSDIFMCIQNSWGKSWGVSGFALIAPSAWIDMVLVSAVLTDS
ncbi:MULTISPECIES: C1 family peptidase [unclassified Rhodococcus (in: high G+C Gram-positive bacteria)]|uniref:C1 family peptidase n=1 Tax=unclassified Rhodococcus (in: high G+C Gram-positive bacteria) TaxID=192944 RepID=UPI0015C58509|nr:MULTISPECIES: C1 family peptidase [unclassified Rhodococcus (in: high G+C Gram-positive bacteria)]